MSSSKQLPQASASEVEAMEKDYFKTKFHDILRDWRLYLLLIPLFFFLICWKYFPIASMVSAFKNLQIDSSFGGGTYTSLWVGFQPFQYLFSQADFWSAFRNTFVLSFYGLIFGFPFPILLALFFSEINLKAYRSVTQVFTYLPKFISVVVMTSLIGLLLQSSSASVAAGVLGGFFERSFHLTNLVSNPKAFRSIFIISGIWTEAGYGSIVYFAAILGISPTNYEAAKIDGANKWQQIQLRHLPRNGAHARHHADSEDRFPLNGRLRKGLPDAAVRYHRRHLLHLPDGLHVRHQHHYETAQYQQRHWLSRRSLQLPVIHVLSPRFE
jgi:putative aldouronate transport system permease protein